LQQKRAPPGKPAGLEIRSVYEDLSGRDIGCGGGLFGGTRSDVEIALFERRLIFVR
jgi:hypothetical protein